MQASDESRKENYGTKPFVFRDEFHYYFYPAIAYGSGFTLDENWEGGISKDVLTTLSDDEIAHCRMQFAIGWYSFLKINELFYSGIGCRVPRETVFRLAMSRTDLLTVVALCKSQEELWNPLYHGHQAAEKALKGYLHDCGHSDNDLRRKCGHDLSKALGFCVTLDPIWSKYEVLLPVMEWNENWRYNPLNISRNRVVQMFDGAVQFLAQSVDLLIKKH